MRHTDAAGETSIQATQKNLKSRFQAPRAKKDRHSRAAQECYNRDYDKLVGTKHSLEPGDMVFVDWPPLSAAQTMPAQAMSDAT